MRVTGNEAVSVSFLLGFGAQKSGSTWLFRFLQSHPEAEMGNWKEFGFWDHYFLGDTERQLNYESRLHTLVERGTGRNERVLSSAEERQKAGLSLALKLMGEPAGYLAHFAELSNSAPNARLVGDITPSYCRLSPDHLREARNLIEEVGFKPKPVLILRDPATRVLSALDMRLRRQGRLARDLSDQELEIEILQMAGLPGTRVRTDYRRIVNSLEEGFGTDNVFFGFYETLFSDHEIARLLDFLNLSWLNPPLETRVNPSRSAHRLSGNIKRQIRELYSEIYEFCEHRFPDVEVNELWQ